MKLQRVRSGPGLLSISKIYTRNHQNIKHYFSSHSDLNMLKACTLAKKNKHITELYYDKI